MKKFAAVLLFIATAAAAQTKPEEGPTLKIGGVLFADYTFQQSPEIRDADGNTIHASAFNVSRVYVNVNGSLNRRITFRLTPEVARETSSSSSLSGSLVTRIKFAYAQVNLEDWTTKGSWLRFGIHDTPYITYTEAIYRYRFQGPIFVDRNGFLIASDTGLSALYAFPGSYGEIHGGVYNGEGYARSEANDQKALQLRATLRPLPGRGIWNGLRLTGFVDADNYASGAPRNRLIGQATFEHPRANAALELLDAHDRSSRRVGEIDRSGWSAWVTPRFGATGYEALLRHDSLEGATRNIVGVAYWPKLPKASAAVMLDYDALRQSGRPNDTRYGVKLMLSF